MLTPAQVVAMVQRARLLERRLEAGDFAGYLGRDDVQAELDRLAWRLRQFRLDATPIRADDPPGPSAWDERDTVNGAP
jgi:hypothetical protein